jgi:hypothetical protein
MYLVLKMPGPRGIIIVKGSLELSDLCDKEFHKMAQNFGMIANYGEPKDKIASTTTSIAKQLKDIQQSQKQRSCGYSQRTQRKM